MCTQSTVSRVFPLIALIALGPFSTVLRGQPNKVLGRVLRRERCHRIPQFFGNGPNTVSGSMVSNTKLSEFFGAH